MKYNVSDLRFVVRTLSHNLLKNARVCLMFLYRHSLTICICLVLVCTLTAMWRLYNEEVDTISPVHVKEISDLTISERVGPSDWLDPWYCDIQCKTGLPCSYKDEVSLRIIVLTYTRRHSLKKCLDSILGLDTEGDKISVDIWVDRSKDDIIDHETVTVAQEFQHQWSKVLAKGRACIHLQNQNAFISGQWINTWRPGRGSNELALILEDDVSISHYAYKWLKATHAYFRKAPDIAGYTLQMEEINFFAPVNPTNFSDLRPMKADPQHRMFLYPVIGTWGFAPHPSAWRKFQDWYYTVRPGLSESERPSDTDLIRPNVPGIIPTLWYKLLGDNKESMWEIWHLKFTHDYRLYTVYSNLRQHLHRDNICLSTNRKEKGLHFSGETLVDNIHNLLTNWKDDYVDYSHLSQKDLVRFNYDGSLCEECCFSTTCGNLIQRLMKKSARDLCRLFVPFSRYST